MSSASPVATPGLPQRLGAHLVRLRRLGVYGGVLFLIILAAVFHPSLLRPGQLLSITKLAAVLGIAALGQTFVTVSRGFDISQGGLIALTIVLSNMTMNNDPARIAIGVAVCLAAGCVVGLVNGLFVSYFRVPSIIATLGTYAVASGGAVIYSGGVPTGAIPHAFLFVGRGYLGPAPVSTLIWLLLTAIAAFVLHRTVSGRAMFACGANEAAARQSGLSIHVYGILPYVLSSLLACVAGLVFAAYMGLPDLEAGSGYALEPIAAAVVGGTSLAGGEGTMLGSSAGAFFLTFLSALIISFDLPEGMRMIVTGLIIIGAIYFSRQDVT